MFWRSAPGEFTSTSSSAGDGGRLVRRLERLPDTEPASLARSPLGFIAGALAFLLGGLSHPRMGGRRSSCGGIPHSRRLTGHRCTQPPRSTSSIPSARREADLSTIPSDTPRFIGASRLSAIPTCRDLHFPFSTGPLAFFPTRERGHRRPRFSRRNGAQSCQTPAVCLSVNPVNRCIGE